MPSNAPTLLWLGRIHPVKGLDHLLDAMNDQRLKDAVLLLGGLSEDHVLERGLRNRAQDPALRGRVRFLGWVDAAGKGELFKLADLFVFPSRKESFGLAAAEAISSGLPAVISEGSGISRVVSDTAALVCSPESPSLAGAIARALYEPGLLARLQQGTAMAAQQLAWPPLVDLVESVYEEAIDGHDRR